MAKKQKNNTLLYTLLVLTTLGIIGAIIGKQKGWIGKKSLIKIATETASKRTIIETVSATGKIYPEVELKIAADISGEVVELKVEEGDTVKAGQLLLRINPDIYTSIVERADAAVSSAKTNELSAQAQTEQAQARISQLQVQIDNARRVYNRNRQLFQEGVISQAELDVSETSMRSLEADMRTLQASLEASNTAITGAKYGTQSAAATLKEARDNLKRTSIYAPKSGIISKLNVEKGERVVGTTQMAGTEILRIADFSEMQTRVDVSENDILRVNIGDTAIIEVDAYNDRKFTGVVTKISNSAKDSGLTELTTDQITNFVVEIRILKNSYQDLISKYRFPFRPGMSASVDIQTQTLKNILTVPIQAVTTREDSISVGKKEEERISELVFLYQNGRVMGKPVKVGIQDESYIEIKAGLSEGEEIVAAPYRVINKDLKDSLEVEKVSREELFKKTE